MNLRLVSLGTDSGILPTLKQRPAIPEASPSLPLAASLDLTFSYKLTIGIPISIVIAQRLITAFPVTAH